MLAQEIKELVEKRVDAVKAARAIFDKARAEKRDATAEENAEFEKRMDEADRLEPEIKKREKLLAAEARAKDDEDRLKESRNRTPPGGEPTPEVDRETRDITRRNSPEYRQLYCNYLVNGRSALQGANARALQADSDIVGGYLVAPQEFVAKLIKFVDNIVFMRSKATKFSLKSAQSLGAPSLDTDISDSDWTSELATGSEDSSMLMGKRELSPHPLAKRIKVSNKLLRLSAINSEELVRNRLGYKFGVTQEKGFMTGNGAQQPLGMFTASARGISTGQDVAAATTTAFVADDLINVKYSLKPQYQAVGEWVLHRDAVKMARKLKDGMGQYIWQPGLTGDKHDTILERPVNQSEYAPNTFTTGLYVGLFGVLSNYWIADAEQLLIQRLEELYAETNQIGFIARQECDGMPVLEEAFARLKLA